MTTAKQNNTRFEIRTMPAGKFTIVQTDAKGKVIDTKSENILTAADAQELRAIITRIYSNATPDENGNLIEYSCLDKKGL